MRGLEVEVTIFETGTAPPFRVRTGRFATRGDASARLAELKAQGYAGFIAELTP